MMPMLIVGLNMEVIDMTKCGEFILNAMAFLGAPYKFGAEVPLANDATIETLRKRMRDHGVDCSELVQVSLWASGVTKIGDTHIRSFDGSWNQYKIARSIPVYQALANRGCLVFMARNPVNYHTIYHVGISLGNGWVLEATSNGWRGTRKEVLITHYKQHNRKWNLGAKIDELYKT